MTYAFAVGETLMVTPHRWRRAPVARSVKADHAQRVDLVVSSAFEWDLGDHSATYSASPGGNLTGGVLGEADARRYGE
jgi:hypothetical protein